LCKLQPVSQLGKRRNRETENQEEKNTECRQEVDEKLNFIQNKSVLGAGGRSPTTTMASRRSYSDKAHSGVTCYAKQDNDEEDDDDDVTTIPLIGILALYGRPRSSQLSTSLPKIDDSIISS
jgi:hypothetical protein